ncbi:MAG: ribose-phosphate diphosphokinase [Methanomethylovorans sp.]|nr:ribose-phosphate diphosphokinase [Methanomethylovorans sp.]
MKIIGGPASQALATRVAREMNIEPTLCEFNRFPDGEIYTRLMEEPKDEVIIIQSTATDSDLLALLLIIDACEDAQVVNVVIPYMGYARQDRKFKSGEPISARAVARTISADRVFTVNIHKPSILEYFNSDAFDLDASNIIGKYISSLQLHDPLIVAPDVGAMNLAENTAKSVGIQYDYLEKTRLSGDTVTIKTKNMDVCGRDVVLVDDMIATGGTMAECIKLLKEQGAKDVYLACVHPVLAKNAVLRLFNAGVRDIIATDTLEKAQSSVSVAPIIADSIKNL